MFKVRCSKCGQKVEDTDDLTGKICPVCGAVLGESVRMETVLEPGTKIGGYEIVRLIGAGGTGNVYLAIQLSMGRQAAVKILNSELTKDEESVRQFFSEVKTLGSIQHPNIVCAFDSGVDHGLYFMAMQYIPGLPLDEVVAQNGPLAVSKALRITESIAEALNHVWTKHKLCHRDIKPGNIMLNEDDSPMLLDFGAVLRSGENSVNNGLIEGSPCFMSPEQARGEKLNFASDLYSLGASLYLLLTGVPPYDDPDVRVILDHQCNSPFPPPSQRAPGVNVPEAVVALLKRMMAKKPADRFVSWDAFLTELKNVRKALLANRTPVKNTVKHGVKTHVPASKATGHPTAAVKKHTERNNIQTPTPHPASHTKMNFLLTGSIYLLITILTGAAVVFMIARSNTKSAENRLQEAEAAMSNVCDHGKDPDRALDLFRRAEAATKKFGVSRSSAEAIQTKCKAAVDELEQIAKENKLTGKLHMDSLVLLKESAAALENAQRKSNQENLDKLNKVQNNLKKLSDTMCAIEFLSQNNAEKTQDDLDAIRDQMENVSETLKKLENMKKKSAAQRAAAARLAIQKKMTPPPPQTSQKPTEPAIMKDKPETSAAAEESDKTDAKKQVVQENVQNSENAQKEKETAQKERGKKRYQRNIEHEKSRLARDIVIECRKGNVNRIDSMLVFPQRLKAPEQEWKDMENGFQIWLDDLRKIFREAKPVLNDIPGDELDKKGKIYSLAGGNKTLLCHSLLLMGYFAEASKIVPEKEKEIFSDIVKAYLEPRVLRAMQNARRGRDSELRSLRKDYEGFYQYTEIENSMRSRMTGGK